MLYDNKKKLGGKKVIFWYVKDGHYFKTVILSVEYKKHIYVIFKLTFNITCLLKVELTIFISYLTMNYGAFSSAVTAVVNIKKTDE